MPPNRPNCFSVFLGKITRNLSLDKYKKYTARKRGFGQTELALSELDECVPYISNIEQSIDEKDLVEILNSFLERLPKQNRIMFIQRYWYLMPIKAIAEDSNYSESKVKSTLLRTRNVLKSILEKEGITI